MRKLSAHFKYVQCKQKGIVYFTVGLVSILVVIVLSYSMFLSDVWAQKDIDCAVEARAMRYEAYGVHSKCTRECGDAYYYDKEGRASCWQGCVAVRDAKLEQADVWLDDCLAGLRDARKDQSPQPTEDALPEETVSEESEWDAPSLDPDVKIFDVLRINLLEMFNQLEFLTETHIFLTTDIGQAGLLQVFMGTEPNVVTEAQEIESFNTFLDGLKEGAIKLPLSPVRFDLLENPPVHTVEVTIDPVVVKYGPALIEVKSYNGEPGILRNGDVPILLQGAVNVFIEPGSSEGFQIQTPDADFFVVLTKFSIIHSKKNSKTLLAVYEGEVEVKTHDGQTARVSPDGDPSAGSGLGEPGVLVVGRKLSVLKLSIVAAVILAIAGAIIWFVKRKKRR